LEEVNSRTGSIVPCKISPELIKQIAVILEQGAKLMTEREIARLGRFPDGTVKWDYPTEQQDLNDMQRLRVVVKSPLKTITSSSADALRDLLLPPNMTEISMEAGSMPRYHAKATFYFTPTLSIRSGYSIEGRDEQILNGVVKTLDDEVKKHATQYDFIYRGRSIAAITAPFALLIAWTIIKVASVTGKPFPVDPVLWYLPLILFLSFLAFIFVESPMSRFLKWLFPYFVLGEDHRIKRTAVLGIISAVLLAVVGSILYDLIRWLFTPP
jgi:hypothetical protein